MQSQGAESRTGYQTSHINFTLFHIHTWGIEIGGIDRNPVFLKRQTAAENACPGHQAGRQHLVELQHVGGRLATRVRDRALGML